MQQLPKGMLKSEQVPLLPWPNHPAKTTSVVFAQAESSQSKAMTSLVVEFSWASKMWKYPSGIPGFLSDCNATVHFFGAAQFSWNSHATLLWKSFWDIKIVIRQGISTRFKYNDAHQAITSSHGRTKLCWPILIRSDMVDPAGLLSVISEVITSPSLVLGTSNVWTIIPLGSSMSGTL